MVYLEEPKEENIFEIDLDDEYNSPVEPSSSETETKEEPISISEERIEEHSESKDDDEISLNFSELKDKTKHFFQNLKSKEETPKQKEGEFSFNPKEIISFSKNNAKWLIPLVLILIAIFASTYFRIMPAYLPVTDEWAQNNIYSFYKNQISDNINQQYPNLPEQNKNIMVDQEFQKVLIEQKDIIEQQIQASSQQLKARLQDDSGQTYLLAIDPYYWFAEARNYLEYGQFGDSYNEEGVRIISLRNGREGIRTTRIPVHPLFGAWLFKVVDLFSNPSLMAVFFYIPVIIIGLSIIPAFFLGRRLAGNFGGFFAAMLLALNTALLGRTPAGFSDTDAYNILFPLLIAWIFFESFETKTTKKKILFAALAGFLSGVYAITWLGYWYIVGFILATLTLYFFYQIIINVAEIKFKLIKYFAIKEIKNSLITGIIYFLSTGVFVSLFAGYNRFIFLFHAPSDTIAMKDVAVTTFWPNVLTTVAEFNAIDLSSIISQMGGNLLFWLALVGIAFLLFNKEKINLTNIIYLIASAIYYLIAISFKNKLNNPITFIVVVSIPILVGLIKIFYLKEKQIDTKYAFFLIIWLTATAYGFTQGMRFSVLMVPSFALAVGITIGVVYHYASKWLTQGIHLPKNISKAVIIALFCLLLITPIQDAQATAKFEVPSMNDAWYNSLIKIKEASEDAIITSWWDFGHWFYAISERKVTFDGAGQGERIHWVGKSLLTSDEQLSVGLLRMLNCGQQKAPHVLEEFFDGDTIKAVDVINRMMALNDKTAAIKLLKNEGLTTKQIAEIIKVTYCDDLLDQYYITSEDMVGKAGVWGHFGAWDFKRATMHQIVTKNPDRGTEILIKDFGLDEEQADEYYYQIITTSADQWISTWPGYQGTSSCQREANTLKCPLNVGQSTAQLTINLDTMEATIPSNQGDAHPNSFVYADEQGVKEKKYNQNLIGVSVVWIPESNSILLTHPLQANSVYTRLFFLNGHGMECFTKFDEQIQLTGGKIQVWKVDWDCQQENKVFFQEPIEEISPISVPSEEKENTEIHASHILVSTEKLTDDEALKKIQEIQAQVTPENFAALAQENSDCPSAVQGGDLGWFGHGEMVQEFEDVAFALDINQISEPVKTQFGYHLILVQEKNK